MTDGLVPTPARDASRGRMVAIGTCFIGLAAATGLGGLFFPGIERVVIGQEADALAERRLAATFWNGGEARLLEDRIRERSPVRQLVNPPWTALRYAVFGEANDRLLIGRDGWLFLRRRVDLPRFPNAKNVALPARGVTALRRRLAACGVRLVAMPVPPKGTVYPDRLPSDREGRRRLHDALVADLRRHGVTTIDLLEVFGRHPDRLTFCRTDSHWSFEGASLAAEAAADAAGVLAAPGERTRKLRPAGTFPDAGDLYRVLGIGDEARDSTLVRGVLAMCGRPVADLTVLAPHDEAGEVTDVAADPKATALVCGTSYSGTYGFARYAASVSNGRLRVEARHGAGALGGLDTFIRGFFAGRSGGVVPETIVWEFPAFMAWKGQVAPRVTSALAARLPGVHLPPLTWPGLASPLFETSGRLRIGAHRIGSKSLTTYLRPGMLRHSGDGVVSIRLSGTLTDGPLEVRVGRDDARTVATWAPGAAEVTVPIVDLGHPKKIPVVVRAPLGRATLALAKLEVVTDVDLATSRRARLAEATGAAAGWSTTATFDPPVDTRPGAAILLRSNPALKHVGLVFHADGAAGRPHHVAFRDVGATGIAIASLPPDLGIVSEIRITASSETMGVGMLQVRLAAARWPRER